jgi:hypothetical protein
MMRTAPLLTGLLAGLLAGCGVATPHTAARQEARRTNAISNKHITSEEPTLERAAPRVVADSQRTVH